MKRFFIFCCAQLMMLVAVAQNISGFQLVEKKDKKQLDILYDATDIK